jgi:O-antigen biosynthesis protein WbqV
LAGLIPEQDIAMRIIGLRPGEKLREELVGSDEALLPSGIEKIQRVQAGSVPEAELMTQQIAQMERLVVNGHSRSALELLYQIVPTFRPLDVETAKQIGSRRLKKDLKDLRVVRQPA